MIQSDESGIDKGIISKNRNIRSYSPAVVSEIKKIRSQIKATDDMNKILTNSEIVADEVSKQMEKYLAGNKKWKEEQLEINKAQAVHNSKIKNTLGLQST